MKHRLLLLLALAASVLVTWLATTDHVAIWPVRNTAQYHMLKSWWAFTEPPQSEEEMGSMRGLVIDPSGYPIPDAWVLASTWDGRTFSARSNDAGQYHIRSLPVGEYRPIADAPDYRTNLVGGLWGGVIVTSEMETVADVVLAEEPVPALEAEAELLLDDPKRLACAEPVESQAERHTIRLEADGEIRESGFFYTPVDATERRPTLLAVYPGPVDTWECVSIPLAAAGYAVIAVGPPHNLELEKSIDELAELVALARQGAFPGASGVQVAGLGGSYSAMLVHRLWARGVPLEALVLLGPPTDLFEMRYLYEQGEFIPPYGLDQVLVALGFPDRNPRSYWRYSALYHVTDEMPPVALFHSYQDDIVPYGQSERLAARLEEEGVIHELHLFDGATHYLLEGDEQALEIYRLTLDFLARHLGAEADGG